LASVCVNTTPIGDGISKWPQKIPDQPRGTKTAQYVQLCHYHFKGRIVGAFAAQVNHAPKAAQFGISLDCVLGWLCGILNRREIRKRRYLGDY
jgi:hypothetical protein